MSWRVWRWWLAGIGLYLLFLVAIFPADYAVGRLQAHVPELRLTGTRGSVWSGSAQELDWQGQSLGALYWRFDWLGLFAGRLAYQLDLRAPDAVLRARIADSGRKWVLDDVAGHLALSRLQPWLPLPASSVDGRLDIMMQRLVFVDARPTAASGVITLTGLSLTWPQALTLGNYQLTLQTHADGIHGSLLDTSGPLMLQGSLLLAPDGRYQVNGVLASRDAANTALNDLLRYLPGSTDGKHRFNFSGNWPQG